YAGRVAEIVEGASTYLQEHSLDDLTGEVERFAWRNPAIFLGAAFGMGFLASRFLKSSADGGSSRWTDTAPGGRQALDTGVSTETARGARWTGLETADSPRGSQMYGGVQVD